MADDVCLIGGTFDPVHHGHLIVVRAVAEHRGFGRVTLVPAANPPHKAPAAASAEDRLAMLRLAVEGDGLFDICELELARGGPSYTLDTLDALRGQIGEATRLHWVVGADMLEELPRWHRAGEILQQARILIAARAWQDRLEGILMGLVPAFGEAAVRRLRESVVPTPLIDISSTEIRRRVQAGLSISYLVPDAVRQYIEQRGLYRHGNPPPAGNHCRHPHGDS